MDTTRWQRVKRILGEALDHAPDRRAAYLDEACGGHAGLRAEVEKFLHLDAEAEAFLDERPRGFPSLHRVIGSSIRPRDADDRTGSHLGPYRLLRALGRGGMGQVYLALRDDAHFKQYVALKVIRRGMDTDDLLHRFRIERQILANLSHPHIARLLDGGTTEDGLPYFVMEYIDGLPITTYCDERQLSVADRLHLVRTVCGAVHYAHQNLIVHRDLSPGNILVTNDGTVKLLDFGIAKLLNPGLSGYPVSMTHPETRLLTPVYASPEQIRGLSVTTASDVYSLGVLLYELLTGRLPFQYDGTSRTALEHLICETEPDWPSIAAGHVSDTRTPPAATPLHEARDLPAGQLPRVLRGDLDTIVMRAMAKDPLRRYGSVEQLSDDLMRYLHGLPVQARADTLRYRLGKFVHRNRFVVGFGAALMAVVLGLGGLLVHQVRAVGHERDRARLEAEKATQVSAFLVDLFNTALPGEPRPAPPTARDMLDAGAARLEALNGQPEVQAQMAQVVGDVYATLGFYEQAEPLLRRSLSLRQRLHGDRHQDLAASLNSLGTLYRSEARLDLADSLYRAALTMQHHLFGGPHLDLARTLNNQALLARQRADFDAAEALHREALAIQQTLLARDDGQVAATLVQLAMVFRLKQAYATADSLYRSAAALQRLHLGNTHPDLAQTLMEHAVLLREMGNPESADAAQEAARAINRDIGSTLIPFTADRLLNTGKQLQKEGDYGEAEQYFEEALNILQTYHGPRASVVVAVRRQIGRLLLQQGRFLEAEALFRELLGLQRELQGAEHWRTALAACGLGRALTGLGHFEEAESLLMDCHRHLRDTQPAYQAMALKGLADLYLAMDRPAEAARYQAEWSEHAGARRSRAQRTP